MSPSSLQWANLIQWPAMAVTVTAAGFVGSRRTFKRNWGFWLFLLSNLLWIVWGLHDRAYALIFLQICLAGMNILGVRRNQQAGPAPATKVGRGPAM